MADEIKRNDQIRLLETVQKHTDTGEWEGGFTYPNCGYDLVQQGLATEDKKITMPGRAALWLLGKGEDPTDSASSIKFELNLKDTDR